MTSAGVAISYVTPPSPAVHGPVRPPTTRCFGSLDPAWKHKVTLKPRGRDQSGSLPVPRVAWSSAAVPRGAVLVRPGEELVLSTAGDRAGRHALPPVSGVG